LIEHGLTSEPTQYRLYSRWRADFWTDRCGQGHWL